MVLFLRHFFTGIAFTLAVYHWMVWLGRKKDLRNLSFALLNMTYLLFWFGTSLAEQLNSELYSVVSSHLMCCLMSLTFSFFAYTVNILAKKLKKMVMICISAILIINLTGMGLYFFFRDMPLIQTISFTLTILLVIITSIVNIIYIIRDKLYRLKNIRLFLLGYFLLLSLMLYLFFYTCISSPAMYLYSSLFLHISFSLILFVFAYTLTRQFNKEHNDLKELKKNLEQKVVERTIQLAEANKQKTRFFINLAHETKTPLTLISNYFNEYCKSKGTSIKSEIIKNNLAKLKRDMLNFLDYEKLQSGQIFYDHRQIVDFSKLLIIQVMLFKELAVHKQIKLTANIKEAIYLKMDPAAAERIINNLLDNAVKYNDSQDSITVALKTNKEHVTFSVTDTGPGISAQKQQEIFKPFVQLSSTKRNIQGIGMGLNIVNTVVKQIDGNIVCKSRPGQGADFIITFPRYIPQKADRIYQHNPETDIFISQATNIAMLEEKYIRGRANIFLVEDNLQMLVFLQKKLYDNFNVFYATNGQEALNKIQEKPRPDIIISDVMMDIMDGFAFHDKLMEMKEFDAIPFIFLSALTSTEEKIQRLHKGAIDYIYKPFNIEELMGKIYSILRIYDALKRENLLNLGARLFQYLNYKDTVNKEDFTKTVNLKQENILQALYEQYEISNRQIQIIALLKIGLLRKEIADRLNISLNTLRTHMTRLFKKCGVDNKTELLNLFYQ